MLKTLGIDVVQYKHEGGNPLWTVEIKWALAEVKVTLEDKEKAELLALRLFIKSLQESNLMYCPECGQVNKVGDSTII